MPRLSPRPHVICPKCGKRGFLTKRWVKGSSYFPKIATFFMFGETIPDHVRVYTPTRKFENKEGYDYYEYSCVDKKTGKRLFVNMVIDEGSNVKPKKRLLKVIGTKKYIHYYVGHYDAKKYKEQMDRYKKGKLISRPNGRKWCSVKGSGFGLKKFV